MTRRRILQCLLVLYPAWWRRHYGAEAAAILSETRPDARAVLDLLRGAADAWARQRPPLAAFGRFGDDARTVVVVAQNEARMLRHHYVGTEHILLGVLAADESPAARALTELGVTPERVRRRIREVIGEGGSPSPASDARAHARADLAKWSTPLTPRTKRSLERSCRAADRTGAPEVGATHLLLGMLEEEEGIGVMILGEVVALERVREQVARRMGR